jgi:hypothetical protein
LSIDVLGLNHQGAKQDEFISSGTSGLPLRVEGNHGMAGNAFLAAGKAQPFGGGGFEVYLLLVQETDGRQIIPHLAEIGGEFWLLSYNRYVGIARLQALPAKQFHHLFEEFKAINAFILRL